MLIGAAAAAVGLAAAVALAAARGVGPGLPLDDAWIHAAFARNLALDQVWGLFAGQPSGGESSLLWPLLLAVGEVGGAAAAPLLALVLGAGCWLALPGLVGRLAADRRGGRVLAVAVGLCGPLLFAALSGMETVPALVCGVAALGQLQAGRIGRAAVLAGVAVLLRPDAALLVPVLALGIVGRPAVDGEPGPLRGLLRLWPALALALLALLALSLLEQRFPPATLAGRRWIAGLPMGIDFGEAPAGFLALVREWARALRADLGAGRFVAGLPLGAVWSWVWSACAVAAAGLGLWRVGRTWAQPAHRGPVLLVIWALAGLAFYAVVLPDRGHAGRYQPQVYLVAVAVAVEGVRALWAMGRRLRPAAAALAVVLGGGLLVTCAETAWMWGSAVDHINRLHVEAAHELSVRTGPEAVIAVFDVGAVAYDRPRALVDLSGLTGGDGADALYAGDTERFLLEQRASHVLLPYWGDPEGAGSLRDRLGIMAPVGFGLPVVASYRCDDPGWARQFAFTGNAFRCLRLHEVRAPAD